MNFNDYEIVDLYIVFLSQNYNLQINHAPQMTIESINKNLAALFGEEASKEMFNGWKIEITSFLQEYTNINNTNTDSKTEPLKQEQSETNKYINGFVLVAIITALVVLVLSVYSSENQRIQQIEAEQVLWQSKETTPPINGKIFKNPTQECIAPLKIKLGSSDKNNYYIKLKDANSKSTVISFFVRAKSECELNVPLGTYILQYAYGEKWYGEKDLFGNDTLASFSQATEVLKFYIDGDYVMGNTIELFEQQGGNLGEKSIDSADFAG